MSIKTILSYLPTAKRAPAILEASFALAQKLEAHLVALHIHPSLYSPGAVADDIPTGILELLIDARAKESEAIKRTYEAEAKDHDVLSEWRSEEAPHGDATFDIISRSLCADLIVTSSSFGDHFDTWSDRPARIVIGTGRPVLLIPPETPFPNAFDRVLVAWNESREATRAAFDAVPLMRNADSVEIVTVDGGGNGSDRLPVGDELAQALARHGVKTETAALSGVDSNAGEELLAAAKKRKCDLLVMGCYGHSRVREFVFGGATRDVINAMTMPVLMSH